MKILSAVLLICSLSVTIRAQSTSPTEIGDQFTLHSDILGEERQFMVYLPESYNDSTYSLQQYPVLYLLDGETHFQWASRMIEYMSIIGNGQIPELIIVGIFNTDRIRDLTPTHSLINVDGNEAGFLQSSGGGDTFANFVGEELIPHVDSSFRTRPHRIFAGHSLGGLLVLHTLLRDLNLFQGYIAIDPSLWWDEQFLIKEIKQKRLQEINLTGDVFIALANNPPIKDTEPKMEEIAMRTFSANLEYMNSDNLRSFMKYYESEDHGSVPLMSLYDGLLYLFKGYKISPNELLLYDSPANYSNHFKAFSDHAGIEYLPPESFSDMVGSYFFSTDSVVQAGEYFKLNVNQYPRSWHAHEKMAYFYLSQGDTLLSIEHSKKSVELNPRNEEAKERLQKLNAN